MQAQVVAVDNGVSESLEQANWSVISNEIHDAPWEHTLVE